MASFTVSLSSCESIRSFFDVEIDTTIEGELSFITDDWSIEPGFSLTLDAASYDAIDDILDDRADFTISTLGTCNKGGVHITLRFGIETRVVVTPLE